MSAPMPPRVVQAVTAARLRLHLHSTPGSVGASVLAGVVVVALLWPAPPRMQLLAWLGALLLAMALRLGLRRLQQRAPQQGLAEPQLWLRRHRTAFALHGLVWGGLLPLLPAGVQHDGVDAAVMIVSAMAGGSLVTAAFDLRAAAAFALPAVLPTGATLALASGGAEHGLLAASAVFLVMMALAGRRAAAMLRGQVAADLDAAARFEEAERHARDAEAARRAQADEHLLLQQLLRGTPQGYWFISPQGLSLDANPAMCELLGRAREEVMGRPVFDFFTGPERETLERELQLRSQGKTGGYEIDIVRPDGSRLHCFNNATPVRDATGQPLGSIGLWTDLSARKRQETELRTYERVTNSIHDMVSVVGADRRYVLVNDAWCRTTGLGREQAVGRATGHNPLGLSTPERTAALEACFATGKVSTITSTARLLDGRAAVLQTTFSPYREAGQDGAAVHSVILVTRDITDQERDRASALASGEYLRRTLNATGEGIFAADSFDPRLPVRFVNDQMLRMWGIPLERAATLSAADIMEVALPQMIDPQSEARHVADVIGRGVDDECRLRLRDGRVLHRRCQVARVDGQVLRVWSFRDVTAEERALRVLHEGEAEQRALLDAFPGYIARLDAQGRLSYLNERLAQALGQEAPALLGQAMEAVVGPRLGAQLREALPRAWAGEPVVLEYDLPGDGAPTTVQITVEAGTDPMHDQPVLYFFGLDVSKLKRAETALRSSEAELRALLSAFPGHIAAVDEQQRYVHMDDRQAALLGRPVQAIIGRSVLEVLGPASAMKTLADIERARGGQPVRSERQHPARDNHERLDLEVTHVAGPLGPDGRQRVYVFGVDITERNRALEALGAARDEAERANQAKSRFLSNMSHELRTPMNAIVGFAQLLRRDARPTLANHQLAYVRQIQRGADHLLTLINELLDLGSIEAGRLVLQPAEVPVQALVHDSLNLVRALAEERTIRLQPPAGLQAAAGLAVLADPTRVRQVLLNLLGNAVKYSPPGGSVCLQVQAQGPWLEFQVQDQGQGLSPDEQARLFQPFERLGAELGPVEGTGIGLALSRQLVQAMGGQIGVRSAPGQGSTFWVQLPCTVTQAAEAGDSQHAPLDAEAGPAANATVLYIDDNAVNLLLMESLLEQVPGLQLRTAASARAGLLLAQQEAPGLILLDIHMPGMDGYAVLAALRADARTARIPVVAVSADARHHDIDSALEAGFAGYLTKPLDFDRLLDTVHRLLRHGAPTRPAALADNPA